MESRVTIDDGVEDLAVGIVEARGVRIADSDAAQREEIDTAVQRIIAEQWPGGDERRTAVRGLLRRGGFKPAGRNKPAQEYLLRTVQQTGSLPAINNLVDVINVISLASGLPISLLACRDDANAWTIRYGHSGESYVFNQSGQILSIEGLICVCRKTANGSEPLGSPVKDSLEGKVTETDRHVLACIYAPRSHIRDEELDQWARHLSGEIGRWCTPETTRFWLIPESWADS